MFRFCLAVLHVTLNNYVQFSSPAKVVRAYSDKEKKNILLDSLCTFTGGDNHCCNTMGRMVGVGIEGQLQPSDCSAASSS